MNSSSQKYFLWAWLICVAIWLYFNQNAETFLTLLIITILFTAIYIKQNFKEKKNQNLDPYKASYEVDEFHDDFTKVGSGYPIKKHQKITCCNPVVDHEDPSSCAGSCKKKFKLYS